MSDAQKRCLKKGCPRIAQNDSNYCQFHQPNGGIRTRAYKNKGAAARCLTSSSKRIKKRQHKKTTKPK